MAWDWDWGSIVGNAVGGLVTAIPSAIATVYGARKAAQANTNAANTALAGSKAAIEAVNAGRASADKTLETLGTQGQPGIDYLRGVVAKNPYELTPEQRIALEDSQRRAARVVNASPLAGSGRATSAVLNDTLNRGRAGYISSNIARGAQAAQQLAGYGANAATNKATIDSNTGRVVGDITQKAADTAANAQTATGATTADTMGAIASFFANAQDRAGRESRYKNFAGHYE